MNRRGRIGANDMAQKHTRPAVLLKQAGKLVAGGRLGEARELLVQVCRAAPARREAWLALSGVSRRLNNLQESEQAARRVLELYPDDPEALHALGAALHGQHCLDAAVAQYRLALQFRPDHPETCYLLANALRELGRYDEAEAEYQRAIALAPDHVQALNNLSALLTTRGRIGRAAELLERALRVSPANARMLVNLGRLKLHGGDAAAAVAAFRKVLAVHPTADVHSNLLTCLNYLPDQDPGAVLAEHRAWNDTWTAGVQSFSTWKVTCEPQRRLRIGFVSPDLCEHSVARFLEPVLAAHDRTRAEIVCYADVQRPDEVTGRLRGYCGQWRDTRTLSHEQLARLIHEDAIDILVDIAGHTANNRLPVFAMKPAPVQVTWLGYPNTTGLTAMDYRLTDARADPPGMTEAFHSEKLVHLPGTFLCYQCPADAPAVGPLPALAAGRITFGSFNNLAKTTPQVLGVWARILQAVPDSHLLLKSRATGDDGVRSRLLQQFAGYGVDGSRVEFHDPVPGFRGHMDAYNRVDIGLDTFPYNGTTTTCEALWMGVPVISLAGQVHAARVGVTLLEQVGLGHLAAPDETAYTEAAARLAADQACLARVRAGLRQAMQGSTLCDADRFARALVLAFTEMWQAWCTGR